MQSTALRHAIVLRRRPTGEPSASDFETIETPIPTAGTGEVVTRTLWLSIDPYQRGRLSARNSYAPSVEIGGVMEGETVGEVLVSGDPHFVPGDLVVGPRGWATHLLSKASTLAKIERTAPPSTYLGVLGMPGVTAYSGMKDIGQPKAGETAVITAASGAVGSVAGQLAKRAGARVVGIAGGPAKCEFVVDELGFDACVDHRAADFREALAAACPNGIDVYFENVGGDVQAAAIPMLNTFARVVMCGMVSQYNAAEFPPGPNLGFVVGKRVRIEGLIVFDKPHRYAEWRALAAPWVADGSLRYREHVIAGLENAPAALAGLLKGDNFGKLVVHVA